MPIDPGSYLRIVANPYLGLMGLVVWLMVGRWILTLLRRSPDLIGPMSPILFVVYVASLTLIPGLFHFHCLDCGRSGRLGRWRRHVCPVSTLRRLSGRTRRFRGPSPTVQVLLWLWGLLALAVFADAFGAWALPG